MENIEKMDMYSSDNIEVKLQDLDMFNLTDEEKVKKLKHRIFVLKMLLDSEKEELEGYTKDNSINEDNKELSIDIPNSPFDGGKEWEIEVDDERGFDDEDEQLTDEEINDLMNLQFNKLRWNEREKKFEELMKEGHPHTQRGFYCYVISQMSDEQLKPYIEQYVDFLERMNYKTEMDKLPSEVKQDEEVMDLRKKQIEDDGKRIGNQVVEDLMSYFRYLDKNNETN